MLFDFLEDAGLAHALRALETETGCARANAPRGRVRPLRARRCPAASPPPSPSPDPAPLPRVRRALPPRRRSAAADRLGPELAFLRRLVLDGDWDGADAFVAPLSATRAVDHRAVTAHLRRAACRKGQSLGSKRLKEGRGKPLLRARQTRKRRAEPMFVPAKLLAVATINAGVPGRTVSAATGPDVALAYDT